MKSDYEAIVVGGGLFGVTAALRLSRRLRTLLVEASEEILTGASFINQNRVHAGFHYPRSVETAEESLKAYAAFESRFASALRFFPNYYAVAEDSETSPEQYAEFLEAVRERAELVYRTIKSKPWFLRPGAASVVYEVYEPVVDTVRLREDLKREVADRTELTMSLGDRAVGVEKTDRFVLTTEKGEYRAPFIVNTAYGNLNWHGHPAAPLLESQLVEMVQLEGGARIPGITLVDGPFCGILPFGFSDSLYWYYSVNYSVHARLETRGSLSYKNSFYSNWDRMREQGEQYFTFMDTLTRIASFFTPRTFLAEPEIDRTKARPSRIYELEPGFLQVLAGKLVTCMDVAEELDQRVR